MLRAFEYWQQTRGQGAALHPVLLAGVMGLGCGIGVRHMARISSRMTENTLEYAVNGRFSLANVRAANDIVVKAMDRMKKTSPFFFKSGEVNVLVTIKQITQFVTKLIV